MTFGSTFNHIISAVIAAFPSTSSTTPRSREQNRTRVSDNDRNCDTTCPKSSPFTSPIVIFHNHNRCSLLLLFSHSRGWQHAFATVCRSLKIDAAHSLATERRLSLCRRHVPRRISSAGIHHTPAEGGSPSAGPPLFLLFVRSQASTADGRLAFKINFCFSCEAKLPAQRRTLGG